MGHRPDPSSLPPSSGRYYETRDSNYAKRYPSEEEEVDDDDDDDDDDDASIVFGESGDAAGGHEGMMVNQTVLHLAEETPRPRRTRTLMTQQQLAILHALLAKVSISIQFGMPYSFSPSCERKFLREKIRFPLFLIIQSEFVMKWILFGLQTRFPTTAQREEAARQTGLTPRKVQVRRTFRGVRDSILIIIG